MSINVLRTHPTTNMYIVSVLKGFVIFPFSFTYFVSMDLLVLVFLHWYKEMLPLLCKVHKTRMFILQKLIDLIPNV